MNSAVTAWHEVVVIPTYGIGVPEKNPIFLEKRVYQGSSGVVYPHPVIEKIENDKCDKEYHAVFIENDYLKIMILPELGGRVQRAYDKIRKRDFVYYNQVIKPALVGLAGPWISGGIEFNWPQHHRPSTFQPIDFSIEENADGSKTVWVNEVEQMFRTKGMAGFTLYPGKAYLEIKVRFFNRTPFPQTFLWWANPAVKVNDHYQSVFPPDVHAVFDHGKRDVSDFPIATGTYYKVNYGPGTDISMYKNIPVPTSYMAVQSKYNFIGCYEHDTQAGMLHVADRHVSTGKKQWTWGNGDFGKAWDRNLTDEDGPYIELMCGAFTDNQPDFSWLQPNEEKSFEEYFMPYAGIGLVKNASKEAAINLEYQPGSVGIKVYATAVYASAAIEVWCKGSLVKSIMAQLSPEAISESIVQIDGDFSAEEILVVVKDRQGAVLVQYQQEPKAKLPVPSPAKPAQKPADIESTELLYLNGLHLEQYRHATFSPAHYYLEALKRDPMDMRNNNAMGLLLLRKGQLTAAEPYFNSAIQRGTERNPNPYDGEAYYNLGICLAMQDRVPEAYDCLYKATWNDAWQHSAFFQLARLACRNNDLSDALYLIDKSIVRNYNSHTARHLKVALLRKTGRLAEAMKLVQDSLTIDRFNYGCLFEQYLIANQQGHVAEATESLAFFTDIIRNSFNNYLEYAIDYLHAGLYTEALELLNWYANQNDAPGPLLYYYQGWLQSRLGNTELAAKCLAKAAAANPDYCFPNKVEDSIVLQYAATANGTDAKALYLLGNYWYANRAYADAIRCWEQSISIDPHFATALRNLSLACYNKLNDADRSLALLEKAFALDTTDARILMELDQLYKIRQRAHEFRLALLEKHLPQVEQRDDLYLERITLYNQLGKYDTARELIAARQFHPWEGGEGKVVYQYLLCHIELAKQALAEGRNEQALALLNDAETYPDNLGEGKLYGTQENDIHYLQGCAYEALGLSQKAKEKFTATTNGISEPAQAIFYNDQQPDKIFYQGLGWIKLGNHQKALSIFEKLMAFGHAHLNDVIEIDYFAVSLPDLLVFDQDLNLKNTIHCHYLIGLGLLGLKRETEARQSFEKVLQLDSNHQGAAVHLGMISFLALSNTTQ